MAKLRLQVEGRVLKEHQVGGGLTIGRAPDNDVLLDTPSVSGHHARIYAEGGAVILEDLESTNGTYVNGQPTSRRVMRDGDVVMIGKHQLVYDATGESQDSLPASPSSLDETRVRPLSRPAIKAPVVQRRIGVLQIVAGRGEQTAYTLAGHTSLIGKSAESLVPLTGWFKPAVAVAITRSSDGYLATPMGGRTTINNQRLQTRQPLQEGDVLNVNGLVLEFRWKDVTASESAA